MVDRITPHYNGAIVHCAIVNCAEPPRRLPASKGEVVNLCVALRRTVLTGYWAIIMGLFEASSRTNTRRRCVISYGYRLTTNST